MYIPAIDGLRALAIIAVLCVHAGVPGFSLGWLGVDLFFVLSGFLITTLLLTEKIKKGRINLLKFMGRRILRLFPAYYLYILLITIAIYLGAGTLTSIGQWQPTVIIASLWGYFNNFIPRGGFWEYSKLLIHLWSLAVEEQYYLIWPIALAYVLKFKNILLIPTLILLALLIVRFSVVDLDYDAMLHTRGIALFIGSYMALLCSEFSAVVESIKKYRQLILAILVCLLLAMFSAKLLGMANDHDLRKTPILFLDIMFALVIARIWFGSSCFYSRFLSMPVLVYIGKISYGIYLYHMFCHFVVWDVWYLHFSELPNYANYLIRLMVYFLMSIGLATLSYRYLEMPFLRIKGRLR